MDRRNFIIGATGLSLTGGFVSLAQAMPSLEIDPNLTAGISENIEDWLGSNKPEFSFHEWPVNILPTLSKFKYFMTSGPTAVFKGETVMAKTRKMPASYDADLVQDLKGIYGLDLQTELENIFNTEFSLTLDMHLFPEFPNAALHSFEQFETVEVLKGIPMKRIGFKIRYAEIA